MTSTTTQDSEVSPTVGLGLTATHTLSRSLPAPQSPHLVLVADGVLIAVVVTAPAALSSGVRSRSLITALVIAGIWCFVLMLRQDAARQRRRPAWSVVPAVESTAVVTCIVAVAGVLVDPAAARTHLTVTLPGGLVLLLAARQFRRRWDARRHHDAVPAERALVVGPAASIGPLLDTLARDPGQVVAVGACLVNNGDQDTPASVHGVPVLGSADSVMTAVTSAEADIVVIAAGTAPTEVERLSWQVEATRAGLAIALPLVDVEPHRISRPISGEVPLAHVALPRHAGTQHSAKRAFDVLGSAAALAALSPVFACIAVAVKFSGPGSVIYKQRRIGHGGRPFAMLKFRSMVVGAHDRLAEVLQAEGIEQVGLFYKPKNDPRITPVGRFLRAHSLDELPQLVNVLRGEMSLVGPRPQIEDEVAQYDERARRRLLVKPGCTGLWQVSGRSNLDPREGIRLDVRYVENWTLWSDLRILARTARVMFTGHGAF